MDDCEEMTNPGLKRMEAFEFLEKPKCTDLEAFYDNTGNGHTRQYFQKLYFFLEQF